jgi:hypothetical protein
MRVVTAANRGAGVAAEQEAAGWRLRQASRAQETMKLAAKRGDAAGRDIAA